MVMGRKTPGPEKTPMSENLLQRAIRSIRHAAGRSENARHEDGQLLDRFLAERDSTAFAALVRRHGPMVMGVCRRILGDVQDAEDAFQATFLILARKAGALRNRELLAGWLYGVALRTARKARSRRPWDRKGGSPLAEPAGGESAVEATMRSELRRVMDEEVHRLPTRYRLPVVLCYLEGATLAEAAQRLGCPAGTVSGRLARARDLLRGRLMRRGLAISSAALATWLPKESAAAVPPALIASTAEAAVAVVAGTAAAVGISPSVLTLTERTVKAMFLTKVKIAMLWVLAAGGAGVGVWAGYPHPQKDPPKKDPDPPAAVRPVNPAPAKVNNDVPEPAKELPMLAEADVKKLAKESKVSPRMQTLLTERHAAARTEVRTRYEQFVAGRGTLDIFVGASGRLLEAERDLYPTRKDQAAAWLRHVQRLTEVEKIVKAHFEAGKASLADHAQITFFVLSAEIGLERAQEK
jgi:RNA polymerase sigma factor (sigma-70 family)